MALFILGLGKSQKCSDSDKSEKLLSLLKGKARGDWALQEIH